MVVVAAAGVVVEVVVGGILGLYIDVWDNGRENGNYYVIT